MLGVIVAAACNKPSEDNCRKAIANMQRAARHRARLDARRHRGRGPALQGRLEQKAVECAIKATTLTELRACGFFKIPETAGSAAAPTEGSAAAPTEGPAATPTEGSAAAPSEGAAATPTEGAAATPTEGAAATPTEGAAATPTEGSAAAPTEGAAATPTEGSAAGSATN